MCVWQMGIHVAHIARMCLPWEQIDQDEKDLCFVDDAFLCFCCGSLLTHSLCNHSLWGRCGCSVPWRMPVHACSALSEHTCV